jgi:sodium-dependent dicarboxylate transporter 2/3/5
MARLKHACFNRMSMAAISNNSAPENGRTERRLNPGLLIGPALFVLAQFLPASGDLTPGGIRLIGLILLMASWWISEAVPLAAASLLPIALMPLLGIMRPEAAIAPYADPTVFLFMGGFLLARAFERWGAHQRVALLILSVVGTQPRQLVLGFMVATACISMWVSNTATTLMMLPIGLAVAAQMGLDGETGTRGGRLGFRTVLMVAIAYSSSIGGMATLLGTPPNLVFAGMARRLFPQYGEIGFMRWTLAAAPLAAALLVVVWAYLAYVVMRQPPQTRPGEGRAALRAQLERLGPMTWPEKVVVTVFFTTVAAWVFRVDLPLGVVTIPGWSTLLGVQVHDATIAIASAVLLFIIPADRRNGTRVLDWEWASRIPWEVLLLFGGGFALAAGFRETGLDRWLATGLAHLVTLPPFVMTLLLCALVIGSTEFIPNTALTTLILPVLAATAGAVGMHPFLLMVPGTLAASCGFMMPTATPPNAIAVSSGYVTPRQLVRAGYGLDLIAAVVVSVFVYFVGRPILGLP